MQSYSKNIYIFLYLHVALLNGGNVGKKIINNSNAPPTGDDVCANYHWFFYGGSLLLNISVFLNYL